MKDLKPLTWLELIWLFGIPTLLNFIASRIAIPNLDKLKIFPIESTYFLSVGVIVLMPMFFGAIYLSGKETGSYKIKDLFSRMRIKKLSGMDWIWTIISFITLSLASFLIAKIVMPKLGFDATPFFFQNMPLSNSMMWILYVWPLFFFFNIFGKEFL